MDEHDPHALVGLAVALTGRPTTAAELLAEVEVLARRPSGDHDDALGDRRALLVRRFLRRRPARTPRASEDVPARPTDEVTADDTEGDVPAERRAVLAALDTLAPLPRAVLVLRHVEQLTLAEVSRLTERPVGRVSRALAEAEAAVGVPAYAVEQALWSAPRPDEAQQERALVRVSARRRRTRARAVLAGLAAVGLLTAATVLPGVLRPDPYTRADGEWVHGYSLAPSATFTVVSRSLSATEDVLTVSLVEHPSTRCTVWVTTSPAASPAPSVTAYGRTVGIGAQTGVLGSSFDGSSGELSWTIGGHTDAQAGCEAEVDDVRLVELARLVRLEPVPVLLPVGLRGLPAADRVTAVYEDTGTAGALVVPESEDEGAVYTFLVTVDTVPADPDLDQAALAVDVAGKRGRLRQDEDGLSLCWETQDHTVCVAADPGDQVRNRSALTALLLRTAKALTFAPAIDDRATWFDARDVLPR